MTTEPTENFPRIVKTNADAIMCRNAGENVLSEEELSLLFAAMAADEADEPAS